MPPPQRPWRRSEGESAQADDRADSSSRGFHAAHGWGRPSPRASQSPGSSAVVAAAAAVRRHEDAASASLAIADAIRRLEPRAVTFAAWRAGISTGCPPTASWISGCWPAEQRDGSGTLSGCRTESRLHNKVQLKVEVLAFIEEQSGILRYWRLLACSASLSLTRCGVRYAPTRPSSRRIRPVLCGERPGERHA
jgi:hypothetical protein